MVWGLIEALSYVPNIYVEIVEYKVEFKVWFKQEVNQKFGIWTQKVRSDENL